MRRLFLSLVIISTLLGMSAQQSMSLGNLKFVLPTADITNSQRELSLRMATNGLPASVFAKVGGVAFIQTAKPLMAIDSLSLGVSNSSAFVVINGLKYNIPLDIWELQSIVNYSNSENNVALTLYGDKPVPIRYHKAFIDNLMGLRLLQADIIFEDNIGNWEFPAYENGEFILSENEKKSFIFWDDYSISQNVKTYRDVSAKYLKKVNDLIASMGEGYNTYIYTDFQQSMTFNIDQNGIVFNGKPYYIFANMNPFTSLGFSVIDFLSENYSKEMIEEYFQLLMGYYGLNYTWDDFLEMMNNDVQISKQTTEYFKENRDLIYMINPIVFDAAEKVCQWSAFFRYIKECYKDEWKSFVRDVNLLNSNAPEVKTPIRFEE